MKIAVNRPEARIAAQPCRGGAQGVLVPVDAIEKAAVANPLQDTLAMPAAAQRAVGKYAAGSRVKPRKHLVQQHGLMFELNFSHRNYCFRSAMRASRATSLV